MKREDVVMMAREAGAYYASVDEDTGEEFLALPEQAFERFAALVAAHEREACAKVCEPQSAHDDPLTAWKIAAAIRAREDKT